MTGINNNLNNQLISQKLLVERNNFNALVLQSNSKKIDPPKGRLLPNYGPLKTLVIGTYDTVNDAKNLAKTLVTGKSDDHKLGRMNDLGLKIGGVGIASYLATKRFTKTTKGMEFIGFGAFVASMVLWPKLFINLPMQAKFGFNNAQKYEDSQGRKKPFFNDNQYLPWDVWSNEKINKVGDHMGIDKNMPDREEFIKKKMQKVALQGNTLWMLTAGFATPLMTAWICNLSEKKLQKFNVEHALKKAQKDLGNIDEVVRRTVGRKGFDKDTSKELEKILKEYQGKSMDKGFFDKLGRLLNPLNSINVNADGDSIKAINGLKAGEISTGIARDLERSCRGVAEKLSAETLSEKITSAFSGKVKAMNIAGDMVDVDAARIKSILSGFGDSLSASDAAAVLSKAGIKIGEGDLARTLESMFVTPKSYEDSCNAIREFYSATKNSKARFKIFERLANALAGKQSESLYTQIYGDMSDELMKELSLGMPDLDIARKGAAGTEGIIKRRLRGIAKNTGTQDGKKGSVSYFIKNFGRHIDKMDSAKNNEAMKAFIAAASETLEGQVTPDGMKVFIEKASTIIQGKVKPEDMDDAMRALIAKASTIMGNSNNAEVTSVFRDALKTLQNNSGSDVLGTLHAALKANPNAPSSLKNLDLKLIMSLEDFISTSKTGVKNTGFRTIMAFDLEKRILEMQKGFIEQAGGNKEAGLKLFEQQHGKMAKIARDIIYKGTAASLAEPELKGNSREVKKALEFLLKDSLDDEVIRAFGQDDDKLKGLLGSFEDARKKMYELLYKPFASEQADPAVRGKIKPYIETNADNASLGKSVTSYFKEIAGKTFNDKKWARIFGAAALALVGVTLITQLFFGRTKKEEKLYNAKGAKNANK